MGLGWLERSLSEIAQQVSACDCEGCACKPVRCESPACMGQLLLFEQHADHARLEQREGREVHQDHRRVWRHVLHNTSDVEV